MPVDDLLGGKLAELTGELARILDIDAGLHDSIIAARRADLVGELGRVIDVDAGLNAIVGNRSGAPLAAVLVSAEPGRAAGSADQAVAVPPVRHLAATAFAAHAAVTWEWPPGVQLAELSWEVDGKTGRIVITASEYRREGGARVSLGRGPCTIEVRAMAKIGAPATVPARIVIKEVIDTAITYQIRNIPTIGPFSARSRKVVFATDEDPADVRVRMVALPGKVMPTTADAGIVLLETTLSLKPGVPVERSVTVPHSVRRPYWVRCFIVGGKGRLIEPPVSVLKER
jgi:hypothetical protein